MNIEEEQKYTEETVLRLKRHTSKLLSFTISRPDEYRFEAGQFSRLGFWHGNEIIWRPYSVITAEEADTLTYYAVLIEDGLMSTKFAAMQVGDKILLDKNALGFFTAGRIPAGKELVMLCTGSGIAPLLSIIEREDIWQKFERIVLVHSVSYPDELVFSRHLLGLKNHPKISAYFDKFTYLPTVTRGVLDGALQQRLTIALKNGELAEKLRMEFTPEHTRFLICGNPQMVKTIFEQLKLMGFSLNRIRVPGQIMMENAF